MTHGRAPHEAARTAVCERDQRAVGAVARGDRVGYPMRVETGMIPLDGLA